MTIKELKKFLENIPDNYEFWDNPCLRPVEIENLEVDKKSKKIWYYN